MCNEDYAAILQLNTPETHPSFERQATNARREMNLPHGPASTARELNTFCILERLAGSVLLLAAGTGSGQIPLGLQLPRGCSMPLPCKHWRSRIEPWQTKKSFYPAAVCSPCVSPSTSLRCYSSVRHSLAHRSPRQRLELPHMNHADQGHERSPKSVYRTAKETR